MNLDRFTFVKTDESKVTYSFVFLTYLIECILERTLNEHLSEYTLERMKTELARIKLVPVKLSNRITSKKNMLYFITGGNNDIQKFYSALKIINFRHPENLYFKNNRECTGNFFRSTVPISNIFNTLIL